MWRLLLPIGRRISIETLEGQILAIDASIWLTQFLTVAARQREQDLLGDGTSSYGNSGSKAYSYDYLVGFLRRLCKLRYQGVRPVLVFDGEAPEIKKREIRERNRRRKRKLGETFYLGDSSGKNGDVPTQEEEEILDATRRIAKRILAKQLKSGQLVTTKNKDRNKKLKTLNDPQNRNSSQLSTKSTSKEATVAAASYAPGFYDPDATKAVGVETKTAVQHVPSTNESENEIDDDHLLRDDYNTNQLKEEINDWDRPIVLDSDDDSNVIKKKAEKSSNSYQKPSAKYFGRPASKFHAGDGTNFKVESVADLPESARKDVIEDALKQRRLASRREFIGVASNPDGLSTCQVQNFLKSTKLNRDIAAMARQSKRKAEEEAKMTLGNGILFEKDTDHNGGGFSNSGNSTSRNISGAAGGRRQHYLLGQKGRKKAIPGMMRMFHHKDQKRKENSLERKTDSNTNDEHDFRRKRNYHYLSGGIQSVNNAEEKDENDFVDDDLDEEKDFGQRNHHSTIINDDGGFGIAITDGSDQRKPKNVATAVISNDNEDIIEIDDGSSESERDDMHSEDDRKPAATSQISSDQKASQENQDAALARALQNIEDEEMIDEEDSQEYIEIDGSNEGDGSNDGGGFFTSTSASRPQIDSKAQQEQEDASLARALQNAEYDEADEPMSGGNMEDGGGFLTGQKENKVNDDDYMDGGGGFLIGVSEDGGNDEDNKGSDGGFMISINSEEFESEKQPNDSVAMKEKTKVESNKTDLIICPESSEEEDEDIDWEEGDNTDDVATQEKKTIVGENIMEHTVIVSELQKENSVSKANTTETKSQIASNSSHLQRPEKGGKNDDPEEDDDDDEVDWEDGDDEVEQNNSRSMDIRRKNESDNMVEKSVSHKSDNDEKGDSDAEVQQSSSTLKLAVGTVEAKLPLGDVEESGERVSKARQNINTSVGLGSIDEKGNLEENSKYFGTSTKLSKQDPIDLEDESDEEADVEWEAGEKRTMVELNDWGVTNSHKTDEVAAALEHAQGTAANLTNWAGRAFRRAVAQHAIENGMEVPESAKPTVLKNPKNDIDPDVASADVAKEAIYSPQKISKGGAQSRNRERRKADEGIDNSGWLETVDTSNTYTEDYTIPPQEGNASDRLLDTADGGVTEEMRTEVMQLLRLFGIPYVVAPAEAEAQCVELERLGLVDGIVTEDSDTFVFGGQVVYKNIFDDKKYVEVYHAKDASEEMNLTQDSLVALAMLLGGDYTEGVKGVGIVNGMEVLQAFNVAQDCEAGLKRFRKWLDGFDPNDLAKKAKDEEPLELRSEKEQVFHRKHHTARTRWIAPKHFPDTKVLNAYLNPVVDNSTERFSWGVPDLDGLIAFCHSHMGWVAEETEKLIVPIIQQMEAGTMRQTRIDSFMRYEDGIKFAKVQSKRLRQVLGLSSKDTDQSRQKTKSIAGLQQEDIENAQDRFSEDEEDSYDELDDEAFSAMDTSIMAMETVSHENTEPKRKKKRYNGKRTRSLATLSSASASTVAIASSSKVNDIDHPDSNGPPSMPVANKNLPKKAPPSYQKQSSTILEEEKESSAESPAGIKSNSTYEVINPSMI